MATPEIEKAAQRAQKHIRVAKSHFWSLPVDQRVFLLIVAGIAVFLFTSWLYLSIPLDGTSQEKIIFEIEVGESGDSIAQRLHEQGLVQSPFLFRVYSIFIGRAGDLKAGTYVLSPNMSIQSITDKLVSGDIIVEQIRVLEGWSLKTIAEALEEQELFTQEEFFAVVGSPGIDHRTQDGEYKAKNFSQFSFLQEKPDYISLEGFLFPDTYRITKNESVEDIVKKMLSNFEKHIEGNIAEKIASSDRSFLDIITMASIIEKEVRSLEDKKIVSGVLWKRLDEGIRLQADATLVYVRPVNYAIVTIEDTFVESPYNTYRMEGLPPGPIANPGIDSIIAALEPTESAYYFYFSPSINKTVFSRTFEEHKTNRAIYGI